MTSGKQSDRYESIFREGLFDGRVVLITGGGSGIGRCTAHELAALGAQVVIAGRRKELLDETAQEISECGGKCDVVQMDIRDEENVDAGVAEVVSRHSRIDGLFNNAGGQFVSPAANMSPKGWRTVIDLNLNGTFIVTHAVFQHSMKEHGGSIVCMLADIGTGYPGMAHMSAARAGIQNLTISLALEWGSAGVQVNCVAPGTILSSGMKHYPPEIQERACREARDLTSARLGTEGEVAAAVTFLLSPAAGYVTGETIRVDGGSLFHKGRLMEVGRHDRARAWNGFHLQHDFSGTPFADLLKASEQD
jgi:citronellol/citronellal dehydrogenase